MSVSLPSKEVIIIDVPEIRNFQAKFQYNFHVPEEGVDKYDNSAYRFVVKKPTDQFDAKYIDYLNSRVPRFVRLSWTPAILFSQNTELSTEQLKRDMCSRGNDLPVNYIKNNLSKVLNEDAFSAGGFTSVNLNDQSIDSKLFNMISGTAVFLNENKPKYEAQTNKKLARETNAITSQEVQYDFLSKFLVQPSEDNVFFYENETNRIRNESVNKLKNVYINVQINNKFINKMVNNAIVNPFSTYSSDYVSLHQVSKTIQQNAIARTQTDMINDDYKTKIDYVSLDVLKSSTSTVTSNARIVGYIIDRVEILQNGSYNELEPIVIENPYVSTSIDYKVKYYATYQYSVRSVAEFTVPAIVDETNELVVAKMLVSSRPSNPIRINCHENVPPPWPTDFNQHWDFVSKKLVLTWSFPPNSQRDIKKFQVFRRSSITEPFQLIREFDFDDSTVRAINNEMPNPSVVVRYVDDEKREIIEPRLIFLDDDFTKDSKYIYALCSVDAHCLTSNYSEQVEVTFDRFKNKLNKKRISNGGSPKAYPNLRLLTETFVDLVLDKNHKSVKIAFTPEHLSVTDSKNRDLGLLAVTKNVGKYKFQFINLDLQKEQMLELTIDDLRTPDMLKSSR